MDQQIIKILLETKKHMNYLVITQKCFICKESYCKNIEYCEKKKNNYLGI